MKRIALALLGALALGTAALAAAGVTTLPTGWKIRGSDGPVATVGTLPTGLVLSRDGNRLFVVALFRVLCHHDQASLPGKMWLLTPIVAKEALFLIPNLPQAL